VVSFKQSRAFTLVELMLVLAIIGLLMMMLIPEFTAIAMAVKKAETSNRISMLHQAAMQYKEVYGNYPPSVTANLNSKEDDDTCYPPYFYPDGSKARYLFGQYAVWYPPFGGKFLAYFLMGPHGDGWHRPRVPPTNANYTTDPNYRTRFISAEWDFPAGLAKFLDNSPVSIGLVDPNTVEARAFPCFKDAFGRQSYCGGYFGYISAIPGKAADVLRFDPINNSFVCNALTGVFVDDCRSHPSWPGDDKGPQHLMKILSQCPYDFMIISPGPNGKYGYRIYATRFSVSGRQLTFKGWWGDLINGITDDMTNFPLK